MSDLHTTWAHDTLRLLRTLPVGVGTVLALRYFARLDEDEICARTGWSEQRVRSAAAIGLRELGQMLQADVHHPPRGDVVTVTGIASTGEQTEWPCARW